MDSMDSMWSAHGLLMDCSYCSWSVHGVHGKVWGSVKYSVNSTVTVITVDYFITHELIMHKSGPQLSWCLHIYAKIIIVHNA